ncbi:MAG: trigger factor [Phycisphaerae bacterium]
MAEEKTENQELKNTVKIEDTGPCKKKVSVEIPVETIKKHIDEQYESLRKDVVLPGFRKGRAPRRLLEKRFGKDASEQVKLKLLADASQSAIKDNELEIIGEPDINYEKVELSEDKPMQFEFEVEVRPEFDLPKLEGIEIEKPKLDVTEELIDAEIAQLRRWAGVWSPREEGAVELDDQVIADAVLKIEGIEEPEKLDNTAMTVRANGFVGEVPVPELDKVLIGAKTGDTKETTVEVPKTYFREQYRGKKIEIAITIKEIKYLKPAEINESFLQRFGMETEDELRNSIHDSLQVRLERQVKSQMAEQVYKHLVEKTKFDLPAAVVADYSINLLRRQYANLLMQGLQREQIEQHLEELKASSEQNAQQQLKIFFIMDKVCKELGVEISEDQVNGQIAQLAMQQNQRPERMREQMEKDGSLDSLRLQIRDEKAVEKILESAKITEVEPKKAAKKAEKKAVKPKETAKKEEKPAKKPVKEKPEEKPKKADKKTTKTAKKTSKKKSSK